MTVRAPASARAKLATLLTLAFAGVFAMILDGERRRRLRQYPYPAAGDLPSQAYQAQQTGQYGGQVQLAGTQRQDPTITVMMSSWACQSDPAATCTTTPGATFSHPITLNLYGVLPNGEPGSLIASVRADVQHPVPAQRVSCMRR